VTLAGAARYGWNERIWVKLELPQKKTDYLSATTIVSGQKGLILQQNI